MAFVSGSISVNPFDGYLCDSLKPILERFAPFTKLYNEKDWSELYEKANLSEDFTKKRINGKSSMTSARNHFQKHDKATLKKIENPIDVLIATDCLSEGQNLQDCDNG